MMEKAQVKDWKIGESARRSIIRFLKDNSNAVDLFEVMEKDEEIQALLEQVNTVAISRLGYNDHGLTHSRISTLNAIKILDILSKKGIKPNIVTEHVGDYVDAQLVVLAGTYLHDMGNAVHRDSHHMFSLLLTNEWLSRHLSKYYIPKKATKIRASILECLYTHDEKINCLSIESGCAKVGDGTDMAKGRARIPFSRGKMDIHAVSALSIDSVEIKEGGNEKPIQIEVLMSCSAGLFQIQEVLGLKINSSSIKQYVEVIGKLVGEPREQITKVVF